MESDKERFDRLKSMRKGAKVVNYSSLYGVGAKTLSRQSSMSLDKSSRLLEAFWELNKAILVISKETKVKKTRDGQKWVYNPVSGFWYSLRHDKDIWSTINQSTGVYCFDTWLGYCVKGGLKAIGQFHDESIFLVKKGDEPETVRVIEESMRKTNEKLKLNVTLSTSPEFGDNYSEIH